MNRATTLLTFLCRQFPNDWPREAPLLGTVRKLDLRDCSIHYQWLHNLIRRPSSIALRHLTLSDCLQNRRSFTDFFDVGWQALEHLDCSRTSFGVAASRRLAACPHMAGLRWLDASVSDDSVGDKGLEALARSKHLTRLSVLALSNNAITSSGLAALARSSWARNLTRLNLSANNLQVEGATALASPAFGGLRWLELDDCAIGLRELSPLLDTVWASKLTHLDLRRNKLGAKAVRLIASALSPDSLESLQLADNPIPDPERELLRERFGDRVGFDNSCDV